MTVALRLEPDELIDSDRASRILNVKRESVWQLVHRGHLHSFSHPDNRSMRLLSRQEVEERARFRAAHRTGVSRRPPAAPSALPPLPTISDILGVPPEQIVAGSAGGMVLLALALLAARGNSAVVKGLMLAGIAALAIAIIAELADQKQISAAEQKHLEMLAREADINPEPLLAELAPRLNLLPPVTHSA